MISVIVPVYQTERYLPRCIDSILTQSFRDFELLLIDDGSKDSSGKICDRYVCRDSRVRVFHKENSGVSDTRNFGLDHAKGDHIAFVDSDDYIGQDYLKILMEMAEENDADMTILSFQRTDTENTVFVASSDQRFVFSGRETLGEMVKGNLFDIHICAKLFKAELFRDVRFPVGKTYEDLAVIPYLISDGCRCVFSTSIQYYYYQRSGSITHRPTQSNLHNWLEETKKLLDYTAKSYPEIYPYAVSRMVKTMFWTVIDWHLFSRDYEAVISRYRDIMVPYVQNMPSLPGLTGKERLKLSIFLRNIKLYRIVRILWIRFSNNPDNKQFLPGRSKE